MRPLGDCNNSAPLGGHYSDLRPGQDKGIGHRLAGQVDLELEGTLAPPWHHMQLHLVAYHLYT